MEESRLLQEKLSEASSEQEGTLKSRLVRRFEIWMEKSSSVRTWRSRKWSYVDYSLLIIGLCSVLGTFWLGGTHGKLESIWSLWQDGRRENDFRPGFSTRHDSMANISIVTRALESGAVCLDGSPPAYFLDRGYGDGANNWVVFHEGGGWCQDADECLERSYTALGSSRQMPGRFPLGGILSGSPISNPDFYNWNRVLLKYCDGGSFNGDVSDPVEVGPHTNPLINGKAPVVFYRGQRIWKALMEELMERGMKHAQKAILSGCSAGGLATILHCDQYREFMPKTTVVKCLSDAGFFIDSPDISGSPTSEALYAKIVQLQNMVGNLPKYCTSATKATRCFFAANVITGLETPMFMLNPAYDMWQVNNILVPRAADPTRVWDDCRSALRFCSTAQLQILQGFRDSLLKDLRPLLDRERDGAFIDSCYSHCQAQDSSWHGGTSAKVDNKSIAQVFGDWYFDRNSTKVIDCPFPCNPTCPLY